jgi:hypothetical protein
MTIQKNKISNEELGQALKNSQAENIPLIDSIKKTNYSGITGQIMFNSIGDPIQPRMCLYQVKNAKFIFA